MREFTRKEKQKTVNLSLDFHFSFDISFVNEWMNGWMDEKCIKTLRFLSISISTSFLWCDSNKVSISMSFHVTSCHNFFSSPSRLFPSFLLTAAAAYCCCCHLSLDSFEIKWSWHCRTVVINNPHNKTVFFFHSLYY